jgi:hypothetical protein
VSVVRCAVSGGTWAEALFFLLVVYLRCVVKAVPIAIAAGAANLLAGVWAATGRTLAGMAQNGRQQEELTPPQGLLRDSLC